jgi:hypothetical protein
MHMAPRSWELIALSLLAGLGFGLALDHGDLFFVAVFGAACGMAVIGGIRRFPWARRRERRRDPRLAWFVRWDSTAAGARSGVMGEPQDGKERRLWNPEATTAIEFTQTRLRRPRPTRMSRHLFRRLALHRLRKSKSLLGSCTKQEIFSNPRGSEFSERLLAI